MAMALIETVLFKETCSEEIKIVSHEKLEQPYLNRLAFCKQTEAPSRGMDSRTNPCFLRQARSSHRHHHRLWGYLAEIGTSWWSSKSCSQSTSSCPPSLGPLLLSIKHPYSFPVIIDHLFKVISGYVSHILMQVVMDILRGNWGKVTSQAPTFLLSCSPKELLLAPEVAVAASLLPAGSSAVWFASIYITLQLKIVAWSLKSKL